MSEYVIEKDLEPAKAILNGLVSADVYDRVDQRVADHDHMASGNSPKGYLYVGASALKIIILAQAIAGVSQPRAILDFACGAGRVTRWLKAAYPSARVVASDVRQLDVDFCSTVLGAEGFTSHSDIRLLPNKGPFDLIWVGSLFTHLSEQRAREFMNKLIEWLAADGILVISLHGRRVRSGQHLRGAKYISPDKFNKVENDYLAKSYGYRDYDNQVGLGFALTGFDWVWNTINQRNDLTLIAQCERAWADHHDVSIIQKQAVCKPLF